MKVTSARMILYCNTAETAFTANSLFLLNGMEKTKKRVGGVC